MAKPTPREPVKSGMGRGLVREVPGRRGWLVMPRGREVGIRRAGQGKTVPASFQQDRGRGSLDGRTSEIRKWAWTLFRNVSAVKRRLLKSSSYSFLPPFLLHK